MNVGGTLTGLTGTANGLKVDGSAVTQPVLQSDAPSNITASVSSGTVLFSVDTTGYNSISVQTTSAGGGSTISYQGSDDNATWYAVSGVNTTAVGNGYATGSTALGVLVFPTNHRYFRANVTSYISGTVSVSAYLRTSQIVIPNVATVSVQPATGNNSNLNGVAVAPATPAAVSIKGSAGRIYWLMVGNSGASDVWVKVYNATSVTLGTTSANRNFYVPKGTTQNFTWADIGDYFNTGIQYAVTGGIGLTDNTAITATTVTVNYGYQ